jgi:hypothetical protein
MTTEKCASTAKIFLMIAAVVFVLYGLAFVLIPSLFMGMYGGPPDRPAVFMGQFFGSAMIGLGLVWWFAKDFGAADATRGVLIAGAVSTAIGGLLGCWGVLSGLTNALGWTTVFFNALFFVCALYCLWRGEPKKA